MHYPTLEACTSVDGEGERFRCFSKEAFRLLDRNTGLFR